MKYQGKGNIYGLMVSNMMDSGKKIKCMAMVFLFGRMVKDMKDNLTVIRERVLVSLHGRMGVFTMECGKKASNMAKENLHQKMGKKK